MKIPVDASVGMPDDVMDLMEPFDYKELQEFKPEYLSGFHSERYNMTSDLVESRAKAKMQEDAQKMLHDSYSGYSSVRKMGENINVTDSSVSYGLLPVWKYDYSYKGKEYPFYVKRTGPVTGRYCTDFQSKGVGLCGNTWCDTGGNSMHGECNRQSGVEIMREG